MYDDLILSILLIIYALLIAYFTKNVYEWMINRKIKKKDAVYYNRKLVHIFAGGVIVLIVPFFSSPFYPLISGIILTLFTYMFHKREKILYWFQTDEDINDVSFCLMWGVTIFVLWLVLKNPWIAIIPISFMAFGDGVTGIVRNSIFKKRTKHPIGNIFMMALCIPMGYILVYLSGVTEMIMWGVIAAIVASIVERYEFGPIDDNILIAISSSIILYFGYNIHFPMI
jgi:dolichol kinase